MNTKAGCSQTPAMIISTILFRLPIWNHAIWIQLSWMAISSKSMENCALEQYTTLMLWHSHLRLVYGRGWGRALWALSQRSERISYFGHFLEWGQCHRLGESWAEVVVIHDIARFNAYPRMLRSLFFLAFCRPCSSQPLKCVSVWGREQAKGVFMTQWGGCESPHAHTLCIGWKYPLTFKEVLF